MNKETQNENFLLKGNNFQKKSTIENHFNIYEKNVN